MINKLLQINKILFNIFRIITFIKKNKCDTNEESILAEKELVVSCCQKCEDELSEKKEISSIEAE